MTKSTAPARPKQANESPEIDYLPADATRSGAALFDKDPANPQYTVEAKTTSYSTP